MKFSTKLFYCFISLGVMSTMLALFIINGEASRLILNENKSKITSLVINMEQLIDKNDLEDFIKSNGNTKTDAFKNLNENLLNIRNFNRREDTFLFSIFILKKDPSNQNHYFIIDTNKNTYGQSYPEYMERGLKSMQGKSGAYIYPTEKGDKLVGYTPIYDSGGELLAILAVEQGRDEVYLGLEKLLLYGLIAFAISIFVAVFFAYFLSKLVSSSLTLLSKTVKSIGAGDFSQCKELNTKDEFSDLSIAINAMAKGLKERERLKEGFARYVSHHAMEELIRQDNPVSLKGERKKATILFSDIKGFTTMSEELDPEEVLNVLNEYYAKMIEVIFKYGGTLDKFIGDGLMVEFGVPLEDSLQEYHAILAAIHMHLELEKLSNKWEKEGKHRLEMGIGIHSGLAVLGNIGSERRMEYTAIGDTVNVASRLERMTKKENRDIIVSKTVFDKTKDYFEFEDLKEIFLRGRKRTIQAYAVDPFLKKYAQLIEPINDLTDENDK